MIFSDYHLDRSTPIPLYFQLKGFILQEIQLGVYQIGSAIPTELEIKERFQISRTTIRQAINELVQEGWLERRSSKGTYVTSPKSPVAQGSIKSFEPFYQQVHKTGQIPRTELLELKMIAATSEQAGWLGLAENEKIIYISRRRFADNTPLVTIQNYLPYSLCSFVLSHDFEKESLYEILSQNPDTAPYLVKNIISSDKASIQDAKLLNMNIGEPILHFNTISHTFDNILIDYAFSRYQGSLNKYEVELCRAHS